MSGTKHPVPLFLIPGMLPKLGEVLERLQPYSGYPADVMEYIKVERDPEKTAGKSFKIYTCTLCNHTNKSEAARNMKRHVSMVHFKPKPCVCPFCQRTFKNAPTLRSHFNVSMACKIAKEQSQSAIKIHDSDF